MNISILIILKDFILFCDEHGITEPTKKDIRDYIASMHFDFMNETPAEDFDIEYFEKEVEKTLLNTFKNIVGIPRKEKTEHKKMVHHEMIAILKPKEGENALSLASIKKLLKKYEAKIETAEAWGEKKLAYPIKKDNVMYNTGFYIQIKFKVNEIEVDETIATIDEELKNTSDVIKFIIVRD